MLKTFVLAISLVAILGVGFVIAEEEKKVIVTTSSVTGNIVRIDPDASHIVIRDTSGKEVTYVFSEKTTFFRDGTTVKVTTLKPEEEVTVKLSPDEENMIIRLDTPKIVVTEEDD